jgi:hypothetical protein
MTDQELKDFLANIAAENAAGFAALRAAQAKTEGIVAELSQSIQKTQDDRARAEAQLAQSIKDTRSEVDGVGKSQGLVAEEFYANSLTHNPKIGKLKFDQVLTGIKVGKGHDNAQFDVILINGNSAAIVEVKYRAQLKTITQLDKQMQEFRTRLPIYEKFKLYGGIAGFSVPDNVVNAAHEKGYFVLKRTGDAFAVDTQGMKAF